MSDPEHTGDLSSIGEGDEVTLTLDDGTELDVTCTRKTRHHDDVGVNIEEQRNWYVEADDGERYRISITNGLSGTPGESPYPIHFPLHVVVDGYRPEIPEEDILGYVTDVENGSRGEPTRTSSGDDAEHR